MKDIKWAFGEIYK